MGPVRPLFGLAATFTHSCFCVTNVRCYSIFKPQLKWVRVLLLLLLVIQGGDEYLAKHLNSYFELLVRTISSQGKRQNARFTLATPHYVLMYTCSHPLLPICPRFVINFQVGMCSSLQVMPSL